MKTEVPQEKDPIPMIKDLNLGEIITSKMPLLIKVEGLSKVLN